MTAKEMFENIGYERCKPSVPEIFQVRYGNYQKQICFLNYDQHLVIDCYRINETNIQNSVLNEKELKAIKQQIKELGWE